jgi:hypothetical protein
LRATIASKRPSEHAANQRITDALGTTEPEPGPGDEGDADSESAA